MYKKKEKIFTRQNIERMFLGFFLGALVVFVFSFEVYGQAQGSTGDLKIRGGCVWGFLVLKDISKSYVRENKQINKISVELWNDVSTFDKFCAGDCQVLFHRGLPTAAETTLLKTAFQGTGSEYQQMIVGYAKVVVIANRGNPINHITLDQIRDLLRMEGVGTTWKTLGWNSGVVKCYGEARHAISRRVIRHSCMMLGPKHPTGFYNYRNDFQQLVNGDEVIKKVKTDRKGIGFFLYHGQKLDGVKSLPVMKADNSPSVDLKKGQFIQKDYPLSEPLVLYLRSGSHPVAKAFCEYRFRLGH